MLKVAVLGLGRFGMTVARELSAYRVEVLAADLDQKLVEEASAHVTVAVQLDSTDEEALIAQNVGKMDICLVAMGEAFEATLLTTLIVKKLGVKKVIARALTARKADILSRIGADEIVRPEIETGVRLARRLRHPQFEDLIELDADHSIIHLRVPQAFVGKSAASLELRKQFGVNLIAIKRNPHRSPDVSHQSSNNVEKKNVEKNNENDIDGERVIRLPRPEEVFEAGDVLILVGAKSSLEKLPRH